MLRMRALPAGFIAPCLPTKTDKHIEADGPTVFAHACKMGLEGIVSKRKDSAYRSGRLPHWLKMKSRAAPGVKGEGEEDWGRCLPRWARSVRPHTDLRHHARQLSQAR